MVALNMKGIGYLRVSTDRQQDGVNAQFSMVVATAKSLGVPLYAPEDQLQRAIDERAQRLGDLYLDYGISGFQQQKRNGYLQFLDRIETDKTITHVFVPSRDRLARPENSAEFAARDHKVRQGGKTLVIGSQVLPPLNRGDDDTADQIIATLEYSRGRRYLADLANKMVTVKANGAKAGKWSGGRPPFGFVRVLIDGAGKVDRALKDKESVRQPGFHTSLRVGNVDSIRVWHDEILRKFDPCGANSGGKQIAKTLNQRGIPSPDAGRVRRGKYDRVAREVPGKWTPSEVFARLDDPTLFGLMRYGKRSMGEHCRLSENGTGRRLTQDEARGDSAAKIIENPKGVVIETKGDWLTDDGWLLNVAGEKCFQVDMRLWDRCQKKRVQNSKSQKGVPRCKEPNRYPLAGMLRCSHCGSVMHGIPYNGAFRYTCGSYSNTCGAICEHFWIQQDEILADVLNTIRESVMPKESDLRRKLKELVNADINQPEADSRRKLEAEQQRQGARVKNALAAVANAEDEAERAGLRDFYKEERTKLEAINKRLADTPIQQAIPDANELVEAAMEEFKSIGKRLDGAVDKAEISELFKALNVRVWLDFKKVLWGKREVNKLARGMVCVGGAPDPIEAVRKQSENSLCKVYRGDRI